MEIKISIANINSSNGSSSNSDTHITFVPVYSLNEAKKRNFY
jgi:hypothetical protein